MFLSLVIALAAGIAPSYIDHDPPPVVVADPPPVVWVVVPSEGTPEGVQQYTFPGASSGNCVNGVCPAPSRDSWYPGKILRRR